MPARLKKSRGRILRKIDKEKLAFLSQEQTADGQKSNFNKLVQRDMAKKRASGGSKGHRTVTARKTSAG